MTIIEALTLCRDEGKGVRPVGWRDRYPGYWIRHYAGDFGGYFAAFPGPEDDIIGGAVTLCRDEDFLGEWEVLD